MKIAKRKIFFSENLKFLRKSKGLQQSDLGSLIGLGRTTVSGYETGLSTPEFSVFLQLVEIFEISADDFLYLQLNKKSLKNSKKEVIVQDQEEMNQLKEDVYKLSKKVDECLNIMAGYKDDLYDLQGKREVRKKRSKKKSS